MALPVVLAKRPSAQGVHAAAAAPENLPAGHGMHVANPPGENSPAAQGTHAPLLVAPWPGGQFVPAEAAVGARETRKTTKATSRRVSIAAA